MNKLLKKLAIAVFAMFPVTAALAQDTTYTFKQGFPADAETTFFLSGMGYNCSGWRSKGWRWVHLFRCI